MQSTNREKPIRSTVNVFIRFLFSKAGNGTAATKNTSSLSGQFESLHKGDGTLRLLEVAQTNFFREQITSDAKRKQMRARIFPLERRFCLYLVV